MRYYQNLSLENVSYEFSMASKVTRALDASGIFYWRSFLKILVSSAVTQNHLPLYTRMSISSLIHPLMTSFVLTWINKSTMISASTSRIFYSRTSKTKVNKFKYLSTEHGVSYDQTEHIEHKIFKKYFSDWKVAKSGLKAVHTPFRTDSQYEMNLVK